MHSVVSPIDFKGKFVVKNELSNKPARCVKKVNNTLRDMVRAKTYNLYVRQDYTKNVIRFEADYPFPYKPSQRKPLLVDVSESIPVTSNASRYIEAAEVAVNKFEKAVRDNEHREWEQSHKTDRMQELRDIAGSVLFFPLFAINDILHSMNSKWAKNFEKNVIDRII